MNSNKLSAKWLILMLLIGAIAGVSQSVNRVYAQTVPVEGASVDVSGINGFGYDYSDSSGFYNVTSFLDTGNYSVTAYAEGFIETTVEDIPVSSGSETTDVDVILPVSGGISGTVTDAVSSAPIQGVFVISDNVNDTSYGDSDSTDSSGYYEMITNLITGTYNVSTYFANGYIRKMISGVSVTQGVMTSNVDITLDRSAIISGTVTDSVSMLPLDGVSVYAYTVDGDFVDSGFTNETGQYTINTDLATGMYNISVPFPDEHFPTMIGGISVTAGSQYTVDLAVDPSGIISGIITNSLDGQPIDGAYVTASSNGFGGYDFTNETGHYRISDGLGTGTYTVTAYDPGFTSSNETVGVSVTQGSETSNVNMQLNFTIEPSGTITGRVTDSGTGDPIQSAYVQAFDGLTGFGSDFTDSNGDYIIDSGLETGTYNVTVTETGYVTVEISGVNVTESQVTADIDFQLDAIPSGRISGHILTEGTPIPDFPSSWYMLGIFVIAAAVLAAVKIRKPKLKPSQPL
jgi:hypothetical protein